MGTVFTEMSSWTALTRYLGMKTPFYTKYIKAIMFEVFLCCFDLNNSSPKTQFYEFLVVMC